MISIYSRRIYLVKKSKADATIGSNLGVIGINFVTGNELIVGIIKSVAPGQDWTGESWSWVDSSD